jgi:DNA-binding response OmpR family regulator
MKHERILVIAGNDYLASQLKLTLRREGYRVWRAKDETDGMKKLHRSNPDLVVIERELSRVSRHDACLRIRQACYIPIIAVGSEEDVPQTLEFGADVYMQKPPNFKELTARIRALLWRKNGREPPWNNTGGETRSDPQGNEGNAVDISRIFYSKNVAQNQGSSLSPHLSVD